MLVLGILLFPVFNLRASHIALLFFRYYASRCLDGLAHVNCLGVVLPHVRLSCDVLLVIPILGPLSIISPPHAC